MRTKYFHLFIAILPIALVLFCCKSNNKSSVQIVKISTSDHSQNAQLICENVKAIRSFDSLYIIKYSVSLDSFKLGAKTDSSQHNDLAKNESGQYINFNIDNEKNLRFYDSIFTIGLEKGQHSIISYLVDSYHVSVKNQQSFFLQNINIAFSESDKIDVDAPHLFYNQPNSAYSEHHDDVMLLDFFLINAILSKGQYTVRATINDNDFLIDEWAAYKILGIESNTVKIRLALYNPEGELVDSPYNPVERTIVRFKE